jgi:hypothetical protein
MHIEGVLGEEAIEPLEPKQHGRACVALSTERVDAGKDVVNLLTHEPLDHRLPLTSAKPLEHGLRAPPKDQTMHRLRSARGAAAKAIAP